MHKEWHIQSGYNTGVLWNGCKNAANANAKNFGFKAESKICVFKQAPGALEMMSLQPGISEEAAAIVEPSSDKGLGTRAM